MLLLYYYYYERESIHIDIYVRFLNEHCYYESLSFQTPTNITKLINIQRSMQPIVIFIHISYLEITQHGVKKRVCAMESDQTQLDCGSPT